MIVRSRAARIAAGVMSGLAISAASTGCSSDKQELTGDAAFLAAMRAEGIGTDDTDDTMLELARANCTAADVIPGSEFAGKMLEASPKFNYPGKGETFAKASIAEYCSDKSAASTTTAAATTTRKNTAYLGSTLTVTMTSSGDESTITFNDVVAVDTTQCSSVNRYNDPGTLYAIDVSITAGDEEFSTPSRRDLSLVDAQGYSKKSGTAIATCSAHPEVVDDVAAGTKARGWIFLTSPVENPSALVYQAGGSSMTITLPQTSPTP